MQQNEDVLASEIGFKLDPSNDKEYYADFHCYVDREIRQTMKEEQRLGQGRTWQNVATLSGSELAFKKVKLFLIIVRNRFSYIYITP